jgi:DNA-binding CsgD family transcriptional regulator
MNQIPLKFDVTQKTINGERLYSVQEISEIIGVHGHTVRKYIKTGELQARRIGYSLWVSEGNLNLWLAYLGGRAVAPVTQAITRKHVPNKRAIRCVRALAREGLSDQDIADLAGISRKSILSIQRGRDVRRSTYAKLKQAKSLANKKQKTNTGDNMNKEQRRRSTIDALNWLNLAGWDDAKIANVIYSIKTNDRHLILANIRNGSVMRDTVFRRLMLLVQDVNSSQMDIIAETTAAPSGWQRFTRWIGSLLS